MHVFDSNRFLSAVPPKAYPPTNLAANLMHSASAAFSYLGGYGTCHRLVLMLLFQRSKEGPHDTWLLVVAKYFRSWGVWNFRNRAPATVLRVFLRLPTEVAFAWASRNASAAMPCAYRWCIRSSWKPQRSSWNGSWACCGIDCSAVPSLFAVFAGMMG